MKRTGSLLLAVMLSVCAYQKANAIQITGGKLIDVVVADSGHTDSTFHTYIFQGWPVGPAYFNVDKKGNIHVLDIPGRILIFNQQGKWISTCKGISESGRLKGESLKGIVVDNCGNTYVIKGPKVMKFSSQGKFLLESEDIKIRDQILVDKAGRVYNPDHLNSIAIYDQKLNLKQIIPKKGYYIDIGIVQKEVGNSIYFRQDKYLFRTSLEEYDQNGKTDTAAVLPEEIIDPKFSSGKTPAGYTAPDDFCPFIGFDRDSCFYFYKEYWHEEEENEDIWRSYVILKYRLNKGKLMKTGEIKVNLYKGEDECSDKSMLYENTALSLYVSGDGTIYWIHGTVDTVKVSKIIFDK